MVLQRGISDLLVFVAADLNTLLSLCMPIETEDCLLMASHGATITFTPPASDSRLASARTNGMPFVGEEASWLRSSIVAGAVSLDAPPNESRQPGLCLYSLPS